MLYHISSAPLSSSLLPSATGPSIIEKRTFSDAVLLSGRGFVNALRQKPVAHNVYPPVT